MTERICIVCGKSFTIEQKQYRKKYCSDECRKKAKAEQNRKPKSYFCCEWCGVGLPKNSTEKYCSDECRQKAKPKNRGRKKKHLSIDDIVKLARKEGLSYGQYVDKYGR